MKKQDLPFSMRLQKGANMLLSGCRSPLWWAIAKLPTVGSCEFFSVQFKNWRILYLHYEKLITEANIENEKHGLGLVQDPLEKKRFKEIADAVEYISFMPLSQLSGSGVAIKISSSKVIRDTSAEVDAEHRIFWVSDQDIMFDLAKGTKQKVYSWDEVEAWKELKSPESVLSAMKLIDKMREVFCN